VYPIRVMARLGIKTIISTPQVPVCVAEVADVFAVTNAVGSLNAEIPVGTSMMLLTRRVYIHLIIFLFSRSCGHT
jgi:hypothetical protein